MLEIGTIAPNFTLLNQNEKEVSLSDFKGKKVVLYFYSRDNTAGCTKQACGFAQLYPDFIKKGSEVIGISKDSTQSHRKFADKYNLTFTLLSDPEKKVLQAYDVWKEKNMYGRKSMGVIRSTYLIDEEGMIIKAFSKVNSTKNPQDMLDTI